MQVCHVQSATALPESPCHEQRADEVGKVITSKSAHPRVEIHGMPAELD